jgi:hypothetical protein
MLGAKPSHYEEVSDFSRFSNHPYGFLIFAVAGIYE